MKRNAPMQCFHFKLLYHCHRIRHQCSNLSIYFVQTLGAQRPNIMDPANFPCVQTYKMYEYTCTSKYDAHTDCTGTKMCAPSSRIVHAGCRVLDDNLLVTSFTTNLLVRSTTRSKLLVVPTHLLVVEDTRTLGICYPA